jgi:hypothetical protein
MNKEMGIKLLRLFAWVVFIIGGTCLFIVILAANKAFLSSDKNLMSNYKVRIDYEEFLQGKTIELVTSPGVDTQITVYMAESIQKHWRSNDLLFIVQDPTISRQSLRIDLSKSDYWGEVLRSEELSEPVEVSFEWNVPTEIGIGTILSGVLSGKIEYPVTDGAGFRTQIRDLNLPISIAIVSEAELMENQRSEFLNIAKYLTLMGIPLILIALLIFYFTNHNTVRSRAR